MTSCSLCCVLVSGFWFLVFDVCLCILSCCVFLLIYHDPLCPLSFSFVLPSVSLAVCCLVPSWFSPLCTSPLLPHLASSLLSLSSPVPRLFISVCVFSLCIPFTPRLVIVFCLSVSVHASVHVCVCSCSCLFLPVSSLPMVCVFGPWVLLFALILICTLPFFGCTLSCPFLLLLCLAVLRCYFVFLFLALLVFWIQLLLNKSLPFVPLILASWEYLCLGPPPLSIVFPFNHTWHSSCTISRHVNWMRLLSRKSPEKSFKSWNRFIRNWACCLLKKPHQFSILWLWLLDPYK